MLLVFVSIVCLNHGGEKYDFLNNNAEQVVKSDQTSVSLERKDETMDTNQKLSRNPLKDATRRILIRPCGTCHQKSISENPQALDIFDLDEDIWYRKMSKDQIRKLGRRIAGLKSIKTSDKKVIISFINCELAGECNEAMTSRYK